MRRPFVVLLVGLDNSGKTTIVDRLTSMTSQRQWTSDANETNNVILPTVGFIARRLHFASTPITVLDMSGQVH